nr:acetyltransferase [Vibrio mimicus]
MLCLSLVVMRCQPLRRALVCKRKNAAISQDLVVKAQSLNCLIGVQFQC